MVTGLITRREFGALSALLAMHGGMRATAEEPGRPELIVDIDVNDEVWLRPEPMTEADVDRLVGQLHQNGCTTLLIRAGCLGLLPYRTALSYPMSFDAEHARAHPCNDIPDMEAYIAQRVPWTEKYAGVIEDFNPPEAFIRAGHERGMKVLCWLDIFDDGFPGYRSKFLDENPHCQWTAKDGSYFHGLTSYAWPEARACRIAQARELLDWGADGIHCSTSAHSRHLHIPKDEDGFGYETPIAEAFLARHGVDIRTAQSFDREAWHDVKGDAMVTLYRELAELCHGRKKPLWIGLQLGRHTNFAVDPHFGTNVAARYTNHWKTLVDEGIADAFILGDFEIVASPEHGYWTSKTDIVRNEGEDLYAWAARTYRPHCKDKTKLFLFSEWLPGEAKGLAERMRFFADKTRTHGFDGIDVHEAWNFEAAEGNMAVLGEFSRWLAGEGSSS